MAFLIPIALIGWVPFSLLIFAVLPRRWAVAVVILAAWLILPPTSMRISGLTSFGKGTSFAFGALLGTMVFMPDRILRFRPHYLDLPMLLFCLSPFPASLANGLGLYDGASASVTQTSTWGLAYLVGRLHFSGERELRDLVIGIAAVGVAIIPFCLYEMRMSPTLLPMVYGFGGFQSPRLGGWRPRLLFTNGLEFGMWMSVCLLAAYWMWRSGVLTRLAGWPMGRFLLPTLAVVTLFCRSTGALALLIFGVAGLWTSARFKTRLPMLLLISTPLLYVGVRSTNVWDYTGFITFLRSEFDDDRGQSLGFRWQNEDMLVAKALQKPVFGWGGWGRARVYNEKQEDISYTDGLWVILLGNTGAFGFGSFLTAWLLPCYIFAWRYKPKEWGEPIAAAQATVVCISVLYMIDCLLNAFPNAVYVAALGGLVSTLQLGRDETIRADHQTGAAPPVPPQDRLAAPAPASPIGPGTTEARLADRYVELARSSQRSGSTADAVVAWRHALRFFEDRCAASPADQGLARRRLDCANDLAWLLATRPDPETDDRREAVELARETTQAAPRDPAYWNTMALALHRAGDDLGSLEAAERSMDLADASTGFDFVVLALAHARIGRKDEAERWLAAVEQWRERNQTNDPALNDLIREAAAALGR